MGDFGSDPREEIKQAGPMFLIILLVVFALAVLSAAGMLLAP
ncbi:MAG TPA: hypothetical protein VNK70_00540 [Candidatus Paceibacterota bacterium]|nr:hypothetical protein [Candidatus Paceibacterota bacterium]